MTNSPQVRQPTVHRAPHFYFFSTSPSDMNDPTYTIGCLFDCADGGQRMNSFAPGSKSRRSGDHGPKNSFFRFVYRLSQSRGMAEEITHDCFQSLIKEPRRFKTREQRASLRTYLCAAARNLTFKRLRRAGAESQETEKYNQAPAGRRRRQSPQVPLWSAGAAKMAEEIRFHRDAPAELP